jgi:hypothetical protein
MPENAPEYSIADDYDPDGARLSADSDPMGAYLTYLADVTGGAVGNHAQWLRKPLRGALSF